MKNLLFMVLVGLLLSQCQLFKKEEKPELPPETREGKRTMGCKVDGEIWLPEYSKRGLFGGGEFDVIYEGSFYGMSLIADRKLETLIQFTVFEMSEPGTYELFKSYPPLQLDYKELQKHFI
jgi:hypothetical protein